MGTNTKKYPISGTIRNKENLPLLQIHKEYKETHMSALTAINPVFSYIVKDIKSEAISRRKRKVFAYQRFFEKSKSKANTFSAHVLTRMIVTSQHCY
ncbi:MAG: hypothetical protein WAM14_22290 [Candidatus Nitrosopolaris sp.]